MNILGQVLLWAGFLGASVATVLNLEEPKPNQWLTIPWLYYGIAMAVGIVGVVLLRKAAKEETEDSNRIQAEYQTLTSSLDQLLACMGELRSQVAIAEPGDVTAYIDDNLVELFADFGDARNALIQQFGLSGFADVMTQFASGERFVNRAWSASADGYMDEASASLERAESHLQRAQQQMQELHELNSKGN
jgi:ElaB/YqjD/DUF883 family membrane-anchored ribosome-binding protein